jgi:hypothetical protein
MLLPSMPTEFSDDVLGHDSPPGSCYPDDTPIVVTERTTYSVLWPPLGFFPFYHIGNGDAYGFYWPVGREEQPPIVAFTNHDVGSLIPVNSGIEGLLRCRLATSDERVDDEDNEDDDEMYAEDKESTDDLRDLCEDYLLRQNGQLPDSKMTDNVPSTDYPRLFELDPNSPFLLCATADLQVASNQHEAAEQAYLNSIARLPEYAAAHFGLASLLRRQQRAAEATVHLREVLLGSRSLIGRSFWSNVALPGSFRNDCLRKSLAWLQGANKLHPSLAEDCFVRVIDQLKLQSGLAKSTDIDILQTVVDQYAAESKFAEAARVWQLIGEMAAAETTSFRERYGLKPATFCMRWAELLELSGNPRRAALLRDIVSRLSKPDGLYL